MFAQDVTRVPSMWSRGGSFPDKVLSKWDFPAFLDSCDYDIHAFTNSRRPWLASFKTVCSWLEPAIPRRTFAVTDEVDFFSENRAAST